MQFEPLAAAICSRGAMYSGPNLSRTAPAESRLDALSAKVHSPVKRPTIPNPDSADSSASSIDCAPPAKAFVSAGPPGRVEGTLVRNFSSGNLIFEISM